MNFCDAIEEDTNYIGMDFRYVRRVVLRPACAGNLLSCSGTHAPVHLPPASHTGPAAPVHAGQFLQPLVPGDRLHLLRKLPKLRLRTYTASLPRLDKLDFPQGMSLRDCDRRTLARRPPARAGSSVIPGFSFENARKMRENFPLIPSIFC